MKSKVPSYLAICDQERGDSQAVRASLSRFVSHFKGKKQVGDYFHDPDAYIVLRKK